MYYIVASNFIIIVIIIIIISIYCLDMKKPFPPALIKSFSEPYIRLLSYIIVYLISLYNNVIALLCLITLLLFHVDYINLAM